MILKCCFAGAAESSGAAIPLLTCGMEVVPAASAQESQAGDPLGESEEDVGV